MIKKIISKISKSMAVAALAALVLSPFALVFGTLVPIASASANWNVTGSYVMDLQYNGTNNPHNMSLTQSGGNITGSGTSGAYAWVINSGTVSGNAVDFTANYTATADAVTPVQTVLTVTSTIAPDGTMSGIWSDNYQGGARTGAWTTTSGAAVVAAPCTTGLGSPLLVDANQVIANDPDSSVSGPNWALDNFTRHIQIWQEGSNYCAQADDSGTFTTLGGLAGISPQSGAALPEIVTGTITGGTHGQITGTFNPANPWLNSPPAIDCSTVTNTPICSFGLTSYWVSNYFPSGSYADDSNWGWTYNGGADGTWVNAASGNSGDILHHAYTVTIDKYIDGVAATVANANSNSFPMTETYTIGGVTASSTYTLSPTGINSANAYEAITSPVDSGSTYTTNEVTGGAVVGTDCSANRPFSLVGYSYGATLALAAAATQSLTLPSFSNILTNEVVIVWNHDCSTGAGPITGTVTDQGVLHVDSVTSAATNANGTADGNFAHGWSYTFHITAPTNEPNLAMKFADWLSGANILPVANNIRISSAQSSSSPVTLTAANTYSSPALIMTGDLDPGTVGRQVDVLVEVRIPTGTANGTYSTNYGLQTMP